MGPSRVWPPGSTTEAPHPPLPRHRPGTTPDSVDVCHVPRPSRGPCPPHRYGGRWGTPVSRAAVPAFSGGSLISPHGPCPTPIAISAGAVAVGCTAPRPPVARCYPLCRVPRPGLRHRAPACDTAAALPTARPFDALMGVSPACTLAGHRWGKPPHPSGHCFLACRRRSGPAPMHKERRYGNGCPAAHPLWRPARHPVRPRP